MQLQDRSGGTPEYLAAADRSASSRRRASGPRSGASSTLYRASVPQIYADIDRSKVLKLGAPLTDVNTTLGALLGSSYVNDFNRFGRVYKVYVQAEPEFRKDPKQLGLFFVRSAKGEMVPLDTLITHAARRPGPEFTNRFNLYRAAEIGGRARARLLARPRRSTPSRRRRKEVLPPEMGYEWADMSYQEKKAPGVAVVFALAILLVFLILAAQYESWGLPFSVLLGTPFAVFGAYLGLWLARPVLAELREQRVRADRAHHADRARREERDPDRRVREDAAGARAWVSSRRRSARPSCASGRS